MKRQMPIRIMATPLFIAVLLFGLCSCKTSHLPRGGASRETPLHRAAADGNTGEAKRIIAAGANVDAKDRHGWTPLHSAAWWGHVDAIKALIKAGADVNVKDGKGYTPLALACRKSHAAASQVLMDSGADVNTRNAEGYTPLHMAILIGNTQLALALLKGGADVNAKTVEHPGMTPLDAVYDHKSTRLISPSWQSFIKHLRERGAMTGDELKRKRESQNEKDAPDKPETE